MLALEQSESGNRDELDALLQVLAHPGVEQSLKAAEKLSKTAPSSLVAWQQRWLYDVFSYKLSGSIRYYPRYQKEVAALAGKMRTSSIMLAIKNTNERRAIADHPLSPKLFIEDMLLDYTACCA